MFSLIINEAFQIPESILEPIKDYYVKSYARFKSMPKDTKISNKNFPPKAFPLDFTGTRYEKLNSLNPVVFVYFNNNLDNTYFSTHDCNNKQTIHRGIGHIHLSFREGLRPFYDLINHEILHFVQFLFREYKIKKFSNNQFGGLPKEKILPKDIEAQGFKKNGNTDDLVSHAARPIEFYPNLISSIRDIQTKFSDSGAEKSGMSKKEFFVNFLKNVSHGSNYNIASKIFYEVKEDNPELYKKYIQIAYKLFVDADRPFDMERLKSVRKEINTMLINSQRKS